MTMKDLIPPNSRELESGNSKKLNKLVKKHL